MHKFVFIIIIFLAASNFLFAQDIASIEKGHFYLEGGIAQTKLKNENLENDKTIHIESTLQPDIGMGFSTRLKGISFFYFGLKYREFATLVTCNGAFKNSELKVDKDNYLYYLLSEADYTSKMHVTSLTIPIGLKIISGNPNKCRLIVQAAIEPSLILKATNEQKGTIETKGMYPDAQFSNLVHIISNIPSYGYSSKSVRDEQIPAKELVWGFSGGFGCTAPLDKRIDLFFMLGYYLSAGDIIKKEDQGSKYVNLEGTSKSYKKTTLSSVSINVGLAIKNF